MIVNEIGAEGAKALSEKLKMNTVLSSLSLLCMKKKDMPRALNHGRMTGNKIGDEGAKAMNEMRKVNTTLKELDMRCQL